jgi:hypothetical protein
VGKVVRAFRALRVVESPAERSKIACHPHLLPPCRESRASFSFIVSMEPTVPAGPTLSPETRRRVELAFHGDDARVAAAMLERECGNNVPFCEHSDSVRMERIRFAALKVSEGKLETLREAVELAKIDWRDLLMWAGLGTM